MKKPLALLTTTALAAFSIGMSPMVAMTGYASSLQMETKHITLDGKTMSSPVGIVAVDPSEQAADDVYADLLRGASSTDLRRTKPLGWPHLAVDRTPKPFGWRQNHATRIRFQKRSHDCNQRHHGGLCTEDCCAGPCISHCDDVRSHLVRDASLKATEL